MRIAYLECFAGMAGDMFLGALIDAGVPLQVLQEATAALGIGASLKVEKVDRSGISATKVHVLEDGRPAEQILATIDQQKGTGFSRQVETQHQHKIGHTHDRTHGHEHAAVETDTRSHVHGRTLTAIRKLIQASKLEDPVKKAAIQTFELLGNSEAKIHNVPVDAIHFHEVGAVDAIVDIVASCAGVHHLDVGAWHCSPVNVGGGTVVCAHGTFPVPAPATADLLRGMPTYSAHVEKELVTPTGAALLRSLNPVFGPQPAMRVETIGYGAGTRNPKDFPNVVRLSVGEQAEAMVTEPNHAGKVAMPTQSSLASKMHHASEVVTVLETALDDISPQLLAYVAECAFASGALDVMLMPVIMKKGRPGTLLTVLCNPSDSAALEALLLRETTTLGIRIRQDRRSCLERAHTAVGTPYGEIRMKLGVLGGEVYNAAPEFEDCRAAAVKHQVAVKQVQQAAIAAYSKTLDQR